jgi:hypothetical protein
MYVQQSKGNQLVHFFPWQSVKNCCFLEKPPVWKCLNHIWKIKTQTARRNRIRRDTLTQTDWMSDNVLRACVSVLCVFECVYERVFVCVVCVFVCVWGCVCVCGVFERLHRCLFQPWCHRWVDRTTVEGCMFQRTESLNMQKWSFIKKENFDYCLFIQTSVISKIQITIIVFDKVELVHF